MDQGLVKESQNETAEVVASVEDTQSTEETVTTNPLEQRVQELEEVVEMILKVVNVNAKAVSPPKMFENNNPDILPIGGEARGYKEVRQM